MDSYVAAGMHLLRQKRRPSIEGLLCCLSKAHEAPGPKALEYGAGNAENHWSCLAIGIAAPCSELGRTSDRGEIRVGFDSDHLPLLSPIHRNRFHQNGQRHLRRLPPV